MDFTEPKSAEYLKFDEKMLEAWAEARVAIFRRFCAERFKDDFDGDDKHRDAMITVCCECFSTGIKQALDFLQAMVPSINKDLSDMMADHLVETIRQQANAHTN